MSFLRIPNFRSELACLQTACFNKLCCRPDAYPNRAQYTCNNVLDTTIIYEWKRRRGRCLRVSFALCNDRFSWTGRGYGWRTDRTDVFRRIRHSAFCLVLSTFRRSRLVGRLGWRTLIIQKAFYRLARSRHLCPDDTPRRIIRCARPDTTRHRQQRYIRRGSLRLGRRRRALLKP